MCCALFQKISKEQKGKQWGLLKLQYIFLILAHCAAIALRMF